MGFKQVDLAPFQITPITPAPKNCLKKIFQVTRTDTIEAVKVELPAQASVVNIYAYSATPSNAATSAAVTINIADNTGNISTGSISVLAGGPGDAIVGMNNLPNIEPLPLQGDLKISAVYAESGTAST